MDQENVSKHILKPYDIDVSAFTMGKGLLAGASAVGLGALCYYGLGLSNQVGAIDRAV
jgi:hypothetical protein